MRSAILALAAAFCAAPSLVGATGAKTDNGKAEAEQAIQAYFAMWSHNRDVDAAAVARFYAPRAIYYGKSMTRAQILADKRAYIRSWPVRAYREVPGSLTASCNADRSRCRVKVVMAWRRQDRTRAVSAGRARMSFDFVPTAEGRKIARESARFL